MMVILWRQPVGFIWRNCVCRGHSRGLRRLSINRHRDFLAGIRFAPDRNLASLMEHRLVGDDCGDSLGGSWNVGFP